jgi:two-component system, cell cycle sensor histidine kinase and response regulator CckA
MKLTNSIAFHFQRFQTFAINRIVPSSVLEKDGLSYWRVRILFSIIFIGLLIGLVAFVPLVALVLKGKLWGLLIFDGVLWIIGAGLLLIRGLKYEVRSGIALLILYSMGLGIIVSVGPLSGGPVSLFTFAVLAGVLLESKAAIIALIVNALTLTFIGWLFNAGLFGQAFPFFNNIERMITAGATFMLLNTIAAMSVAVLVKGLISTHQKERDLTSTLEREQAYLIKVKKELESEVAEHKRTEETLRTSEEKYRLLAENVSDVIWTMDMDLNYTYISPAIEKIQGWSAEETESLTINDFLTPLSIENALKHMEAHLADGAKTGDYNISERFELELYCKDGTTIWAEIIASSILGEDGKPVGILGATRDITERKKLEAQLQRSQKMEAIGLLAGGVAHDLNNVLSGIVSYPDLLLMELEEESPLRKPILTIQSSGQKAAEIVQDLLALARRGVENKIVLNLNEIIFEYLKSPEYEKLKTYHSNVSIETNLDTNLLNIEGSSTQLRKTIMNLVSNAAEAQPAGGKITISTRNQYVDTPIKGYEEIKEGGFVVFEVKDTGLGIASKDLSRIFEPFYTKKVMGRSGTGLGMAVVWGTTHDNNGYLDIKSSEGVGTTFSLYFPITRGEKIKKKGLIPVEEYMGKKETVLVIDDVSEQRDIAANILGKLNYTVVTVSSGEDAVEYMKNNSVDLLILDMIMEPGIDGLETYRRIIKLHSTQKAIIASGYSETDRVKEVQKLGAGEYIKKPYTLEKIGIAVKEELGK